MNHPETPLEEILTRHDLEPGAVQLWEHFIHLALIPRASKQEQQAVEYLQNFATNFSLPYETDSVGNTLIKIPPSPEFQQSPGVILQSHLDMVCIGDPDPATHGVQPIISPKDPDWLTARETTLGADNGIGVSTMLSLAENSSSHGPLGLLFTTDEETGLTGAIHISLSDKLESYRYLLNLDSEKEGEATIGCAGGGDTVVLLPISRYPLDTQRTYELCIEGLMGGHSGVDIHEQRLNAISLLSRILSELEHNNILLNLVNIEGGVARNAIPVAATASITLDENDIDRVNQFLQEFQVKTRRQALHEQEMSLTITLKQKKQTLTTMFGDEATKTTIKLLNSLPHGVLTWNDISTGLVKTSTNLARVKLVNDAVVIETSTRSFSDEERDSVRRKIQALARSLGAQVKQEASYPAWEPQAHSYINKVVQNVYKHLANKNMDLRPVHAGLECGILLKKFPHLQAISIGPTIEGAHTTEEKVYIPSVSRFYKLTEQIIQELSSATN